MPMLKLHIQHNTPQWMDMRRMGIGGSDAAAVLGLSPFKTNVDIWEEKVGIKDAEDISAKPQVQYGREAEDLLFKLFALDHPQYKCATNKETVYRRGFMFASLDGELMEKGTGRRGIFECKTTEIHSHKELAKWEKRVPDYYYTQILHYLIVTGWDFVKLKAQLKMLGTGGEVELITRHYTFDRKDVAEDLQYVYIGEKTFWGYVERNERPPLILPNIERN